MTRAALNPADAATVDRYLPPFAPSAAWRLREAEERSRASRELDARLRAANPEEPRQPSDYGLTIDELRREGNRLAREGWPVDEVREILALPTPARVAS